MAITQAAAALGRAGETRAAAYLRSLGWQILDRNWRCRHGELDIVAREADGQTVVFVEVKCRRSLAFGEPIEAVTPAKAARLRGLAYEWLRATGTRSRRIRLDAVGVLLPARGRPQLRHIQVSQW